MHMYIVRSLDRDDLLYMSACHQGRTWSLLPDTLFECCDRRTVHNISCLFFDLENIY